MKKRLLLTFMVLSFSLWMKAAQIVITVSEAGILINEFTIPLTDVSDLKVIGPIDARDFKTIRDELTKLEKLDISEATIVAYTGTGGTSSAENYAADAIPENAFYVPAVTNFFGMILTPEKTLSLKEILFPISLKAIGNSAVRKLLELSSPVLDLSHIPLETIGNQAFMDNSTLTEIKLPSSIKSFGASAFQNCSALTMFTVPTSTTSLGNDLLSGCSSISKIDFEMPSSLTAIGGGFFVGMPRLMSVTIPASILNLDGAFSFTGNSFAGTEIVVDNANPNYASEAGILYNKEKTTLLFFPLGKTSAAIAATTEIIETRAFYKSLLTAVVIPKSVRTIGDLAFAENAEMEQLTFDSPSSLESIGRMAFRYNTKLGAVQWPASLKTIGQEAFQVCPKMTCGPFPASLTSIGDAAFYGTGITDADLSASTGLTTLGLQIFKFCAQLVSVRLPATITSIPSSFVHSCNSLQSFSIAQNVKSIGSSAFAFSGITSIVLPEGLEAIGEDAFTMTRLTSIRIPQSVTNIEMGLSGSPFNRTQARITVASGNPNYSSLGGILYNKNASTLIVAPMFLSGNFVVPSTVTKIEPYAFYQDSLLTSVELPKNIGSLGDFFLQDCTGLLRVIIKNPVPIEISQMGFTFMGTSNITLHVPKGSLAAYKGESRWVNSFVDIKGTSSFYNLGDGYANKISPNGKYVVGTGNRGFIWESKDSGEPQITYLAATDLEDVNDSGLVAGRFLDPAHYNIPSGGVYDPATNAWKSIGMGRYGNAPNPSNEAGSIPCAITEDGWVFGMSNEKDNLGKIVPMVWKPNPVTGQYTDTVVYHFPEDHLSVNDRYQGSRFMDVSADGSVACGWSVFNETSGNRIPTLWKSATEYKLINEPWEGVAYTVSPNGKYLALTSGMKAALYDIENDTLIFVNPNVVTSASAVSNDGTVVGFRATDAKGRLGFIWSDRLGYFELKEFVDKYAPEMTLPEELEFTEDDDYIMNVPMSISGNGLTIAGWKGLSGLRYAWAMELPAPLDLVSRPQKLTASVEPLTRNVVLLSWSPPTDIGTRLLDFYKIYRNGEFLMQVDAEQTTYTDTDAPSGHVRYSVSALYDTDRDNRESNPSGEAIAPVVDNYDLPLYETFEKGFQPNFWEVTGGANNKWRLEEKGYNTPYEYGHCIAFSAAGNRTDYAHTFTSKPLDATGKNKVTVSYLYSIDSSPVTVGTKDTIIVEVGLGINPSTWTKVTQYLLQEPVVWTPQTFDLSDLVKNSIFRLRFRASSGANRNYMIFYADELSVSTNTVSVAQGVKALKTSVGNKVIWQDASGSYGLTYAGTSNVDVIGNAGVPFIAANRFPADSLRIYKDLKLTSITAYITAKVRGATKDTKLKLAVFVDGVRVNTQSINSFEEDAWNTFPLVDPIALSDVTNSLIFGIEVAEHDRLSVPLAVDWTTAIPNRGDIYSEDGGNTWQTLTAWEAEHYNEGFLAHNWSIIGNVRTEAASEERTAGILGYELYRGDTKISPRMIYGQYFIDRTTEETPCYKVKVFHSIGGLSAASTEGCLDLTAIGRVPTEEIVVYPNPTSAKVYIRSAAGRNPEIILFNLAGERLLRTTGDSVDLSEYASGIYLLQVNGQTFKVTKK